jgi:hypothetical protein
MVTKKIYNTGFARSAADSGNFGSSALQTLSGILDHIVKIVKSSEG